MSSEDEAPSSPRLLSSYSTHTDYLHTDLKVFAPFAVCLHGLSAQQVSRQQRIDWGGTPHHPSLLSARGSPQVRILLHSAPKQLPARFGSAGSQASAPAAAGAVVVVPVWRVTDGMGGGGPRPTHPCLIDSWSGLPAGGAPEQLALCKEAVHFFLPGKFCQDGGVPQHAPGTETPGKTSVTNGRQGKQQRL